MKTYLYTRDTQPAAPCTVDRQTHDYSISTSLHSRTHHRLSCARSQKTYFACETQDILSCYSDITCWHDRRRDAEDDDRSRSAQLQAHPHHISCSPPAQHCTDVRHIHSDILKARQHSQGSHTSVLTADLAEMSSPNTTMLHPQDGYFPPSDSRRRSSSHTAERYRPRGYSNPPPQQADPSLLHPAQVPLPMSGQSTPLHQPPYPTDNSGQPRVDMPLVPARQLADEIPMRRSVEVAYPDGLRRPSYDASNMRRASHDSRRSHRSERSHHSHHSHRQQYEDDDDDGHEPSHHQHHQHIEREGDIDAYRKRQKDKGNNVSRSFGDSLISVLSPLKYLFEPRDKY